MTEFKDHKTILVGDADCDGKAKSLCEKFKVEGFPTLKSGSPDSMEDYQGDRKFEDLKAHAAALKPTCSPSNPDACAPEDKVALLKMLEVSKEELEKLVNAAAEKNKATEKIFEEEVDALQKSYDAAEKKKTDAVAAVNTPELKLAKKVFVHKGGILPEEPTLDDQGGDEDMGDEDDHDDHGDDHEGHDHGDEDDKAEL